MHHSGEILQDQSMRLPRVRFTVRRMMVAVAVVGILLAGLDLSVEYSRRAEQYEIWLHGFHSSDTA
jgi:alkylation response protein AidB-like acyl-CoA dehydrogenase